MTRFRKADRGRTGFVRGERGSIAIQTAIMLIAILGMVALGTEITFLLLKHREMQSAADSAAASGATALGLGSPADFRMQARGVAGASGFTAGVDNTTVTVNSPPLSGPNAGNPDAVEVIISQPQQLSLIKLFRSGLFDVGARAVALAQPGYRYCILALDPSAPSTMKILNNAVVTNPTCGVADNSSSTSALEVRNNAAVNGPVRVHGEWVLQNNAELNGRPNTQHASPVDDPYADVALQTPPACTAQSGAAGNMTTVNLNSGHFCAGFNFGNSAVINLAAGEYYIDHQFAMGNNVTINGTDGVTLIINGNYSVTFSNGATVRLTAPTSGPYAGIAIFGLREATPTVVQTFRNNAVFDVQGAIYFPNQIINFENNSATGFSKCTQIIGRMITISNNAILNNDCDATGVRPIGEGLGQLVE